MKLGYKNKSRNNVGASTSLANTFEENQSNNTSVLTICANCNKAKEDEMNWTERYSPLSNYIDEEVSHGICPSCITLLYPDIADDIIDGLRQ